MSNEIHETQSPNPGGGGLVSNDFKKMLIPIAVTLVISFSGSWYAAQQSQSELRFKTEANKEAIVGILGNIKELAESQKQIVTQQAIYSESQKRIAEDLKQLQADQRNNNFQMNRQK